GRADMLSAVPRCSRSLQKRRTATRPHTGDRPGSSPSPLGGIGEETAFGRAAAGSRSEEVSARRSHPRGGEFGEIADEAAGPIPWDGRPARRLPPFAISRSPFFSRGAFSDTRPRGDP